MQTKIMNHLYFAACFVAAVGASLPTDWVNLLFFVNPQTRPALRALVVAVASGAAWLKGHWNYVANIVDPPVVK